MADDILCAEIEEGIMNFEDYVSLYFLSILEKELSKPLRKLIFKFKSSEEILVKALKELKWKLMLDISKKKT